MGEIINDPAGSMDVDPRLSQHLLMTDRLYQVEGRREAM